jgi:hypothetical protein
MQRRVSSIPKWWNNPTVWGQGRDRGTLRKSMPRRVSSIPSWWNTPTIRGQGRNRRRLRKSAPIKQISFYSPIIIRPYLKSSKKYLFYIYLYKTGPISYFLVVPYCGQYSIFICLRQCRKGTESYIYVVVLQGNVEVYHMGVWGSGRAIYRADS